MKLSKEPHEAREPRVGHPECYCIQCQCKMKNELQLCILILMNALIILTSLHHVFVTLSNKLQAPVKMNQHHRIKSRT